MKNDSWYLRGIKHKLYKFYPEDEYTVNKTAGKIFLKGIVCMIPFLIIICIFYDGGLFYPVTGICAMAMLFDNVIATELNNVEYKLLSEFKSMLDDVRHYYYETGMLDDALYFSMDTASHELCLHINRFYSIVTSATSLEAVEDYVENSPNRFFLTFASNCASIKEYGDSVVSGESVFLKNLGYLKESISDELLHLDMVKALFSGLVIVCVFPVFLLKPFELWGGSVFPEMKEFYSNNVGMICVFIIYVVTLIVYEMIVSIRNERKQEKRDMPILDKLMENKLVRRIAVLYDDYNASRAEKIGDMLRATGNMCGTQKFFLQRAIIAIVVFVIVNVMSFVAVHNTTSRLLMDFENEFTTALIPNEEYRNTMRETAKEYAAINKRNLMSEEKLVSMISEEEQMEDEYAKLIADVVSKRVNNAKDNHYKWYMLACALLCAFISYEVPYLLLIYKSRMAFLEQQNEMEQFHTIALILMNMDGITINIILEWMSRFAFCFKEEIERCIFELEKSEEDALFRLKENEYKPFVHFVDCLIAIDRVGVKAAFSQIEQERLYNKEKRRQDNRYNLDRKARMCKTIAFIPLYAAVFGYLIIPFAIAAINMISEFPAV